MTFRLWPVPGCHSLHNMVGVDALEVLTVFAIRNANENIPRDDVTVFLQVFLKHRSTNKGFQRKRDDKLFHHCMHKT